ncbi:putative ubiquinone biosynthesis hydroxylase [Octadecabacter antarcticus 307]|uniref:Putative ubiquinone biosynthesis hydroxylase n=1 Tax=Octadecabacter antarcticus 307 TaxID=391626 RepID=M9RC32_9RHOB|nr:UbiH/UbiF family hydroxylase [Octadecabacter antarcticus]AGI67365.1 putative ubiquinone biosynthesis hydroxylase [Octadecabacter antarcticus 307]
MINTDIFISGGGVAGLTTAAAFGAAGFSVVIADPMQPITDNTTNGADLRTTAFLQPAREFLIAAGLWDRLAPFATPLQIMRIVDAGGADPTPRVTRDFDAANISELPFGWNLSNWLLRREIVARLADLPNIDFRPGVGFATLLTRTNEARVTLTDGTRITAKLVIAADGRNSPVRQAAGITAKTTRYGQKAVTFAVTHDAPHNNVSTEIHRSGGPFTLVPLPDHDGRPCSAVVWMDDGPEANRLAALPEPDFNAQATLRSGGTYGPLTLASRRMVWPIISQIAARMAGERVALVAESAHVVPPIGAQGLNMSLSDVACLLDLAQANRDTLGSADMLAKYHRARHPDIRLRVAGVGLLNRASQAENPLLRDIRAKGIETFYGIAPLRKTLMKLGLGARG